MRTSVSPPPLKRRRLQEDQDVRYSSHNRHLQLSIYSWNVNGIDPLLQNTLRSFWQSKSAQNGQAAAPLAPLREFLRRHEWPTLCLLQEVKIRSGDAAKIRAVQRAVSDPAIPETDYIAHFCLPTAQRYRRGNSGKLYGVCTLVRKDYAQGFVDRVRQVDWDAEGRILIVETKATAAGPRLAIINVYLVNGTDLPYRDEETNEIIGTRHDRKLAVHRLLHTECHRLQAKGFGIIIAGDINIARTELDGHPDLRVHPRQHVLNRADFERRFFDEPPSHDSATNFGDSCSVHRDVSALGFVDTFRFLHPRDRAYSFYSRAVDFGQSCDRVDMVIASSLVARSCVAAGIYGTKADRGSSDHVPIYARFKFEL